MALNRNLADWKGNLVIESANKIREKNPEEADFRENLHKLLSEIFRRINSGFETISSGDIFSESSVSFLAAQLAVQRQITKSVAGGIITFGHSTALADDAALTLNCVNASYDSPTNILTLTPKTQTHDTEGHGKAPSSGAAINLSLGVDTKQIGALVSDNATFVNIPTTRGTSTILEFVVSASGSDLQLKAGSSSNDYIKWDGSAWSIAAFPASVTAISVLNNGTSISTTANSINIPAGSVNALVWGGSGTNVTLGFAGGAGGKVIYNNGSIWTVDFPVTADETWIHYVAPNLSHVGPSPGISFNYGIVGADRWILDGNALYPFDAKGHANATTGRNIGVGHADPDLGGPLQTLTFPGPGSCLQISFDRRGHVPVIKVLSVTGSTSYFWDGTTSSAAFGPPTNPPNRIEVDLGDLPLSEKSIVITDTRISASNKIIAQIMHVNSTTKDADEFEMDAIDIKCDPQDGGFVLYLRGLEGYLEGTFVVDYLII